MGQFTVRSTSASSLLHSPLSQLSLGMEEDSGLFLCVTTELQIESMIRPEFIVIFISQYLIYNPGMLGICHKHTHTPFLKITSSHSYHGISQFAKLKTKADAKSQNLISYYLLKCSFSQNNVLSINLLPVMVTSCSVRFRDQRRKPNSAQLSLLL